MAVNIKRAKTIGPQGLSFNNDLGVFHGPDDPSASPSIGDATAVPVGSLYISNASPPHLYQRVNDTEDPSVDWVDLGSTGAGGANTLDQAYDQGGAGVGRTINVDAKAVKFVGSGGYAPFELPSTSTVPNTDLQSGQLVVVNEGSSLNGGDILYIYDNGTFTPPPGNKRSTWLSVERFQMSFFRHGPTKNQYLNHFGNELLPSSIASQPLVRDAMLIGITIQLLASATVEAVIRKNDDETTDLISRSMLDNHRTYFNVNTVTFSEGDRVQVYFDTGTSTIDSPSVTLTFAWRL